MTRRLGFVALLAAILSLSGCGKDHHDTATPRTEPVTSFDARPGTTRVYESFGKTGGETTMVTIATPSKEVDFRFDCVGGKGEIKVALSDGGAGFGVCDSAQGMVLMAGEDKLVGSHTVTVTAPEGATWSAAVDVK